MINIALISEVVTASDIYWLTRLDPLNVTAGVLLFASVTIALFGLIAIFMEDDNVKVLFKPGIAVTILSAGVLIFLPSTKEAVAMMVIPKIANNEDIQGLGKETIDLARDWLKELSPQKEIEKPK